MKKPKTKKKEVVQLVRCRNAGVHVGVLKSRTEHILVLKNSRRIWRWRGANTCSDIAMNGCDTTNEYTRISQAIPMITLTCSDVCEVIPMTEAAAKTIMGAKSWK